MKYNKRKHQVNPNITAGTREYIAENPKTIGIFFGGCSTEYEVSLQSACSVIRSIDRKKYNLVLIGIDRRLGTWFWYRGEAEQIGKDCWQSETTCAPVFVNFDKTAHGLCYLEHGKLRSISLDAALPILHGKNGEDGTLQGALELMGVPIIGCGLLSSAVCMDKELAHSIVAMNGIKVAKSISIEKEDSEADVKKVALKLGYPLFVKPVRSGSSFGITKVFKEQDLLPAVRSAFEYDSRVILEEMIEGFEVGCAVLGVAQPMIGEVDEIELSEGFFDYTEKYTLKTSKIHVPARINAEKAEEIKNTAFTIYKTLGCSHFARVDMFLTPTGEIYFNEVNTIPGFTSHSRYPNMLKAAGLSFEEVVDSLLEMGV